MILTNKKIAILGAGKSGLSAARLALRAGGMPHVFDISPNLRPDWPGDIPLTISATEEVGREFAADIVVISPGMEADSPFVLSFCHQAEELMGEIEFASRFYNGTIIGITGTNGKTTVTELIEKILLTAGKSAKACGNYGYPFSEVALMDPQPEIAVVELSSFQLETVKQLHVDVAIWLNFAPDHMDRYTSLEDYHAAKLHLFDNQTEVDTAIIRQGEDIPSLPAKTFTFSSDNNQASVHYENDGIYEGSQLLLSLKGTKMNIKHNAENVMAAILAMRALQIPVEAVTDTLTTFAPPLHRCELISILDGVEYLNDSKSTNIHSLESALRSQTKPVILIAGGKDKGLDYSSLLPLLKTKAKAAVVFGQIKDQLFHTFHNTIPTKEASTLEETVLLAQELASSGYVVLFSPGTSSFDMFSGYEQRGDAFRKTVLNLKSKPTPL